jgi:hypothetical protein
MDATKLFNAAKIIAGSKPQLSEELNRIAQDISGMPIEEPAGLLGDVPPQDNLGADANPNIKNFATPATETEKVTHKITLTITAPKGLGELEVMNEVLPVINQIKDKDGIELKGYQFTQS